MDFATSDELVRKGEPRAGSSSSSRDGRESIATAPRFGISVLATFSGRSHLVDGSPRTATLTALESIDALTVDRTDFIDLLPVFRLEILNALTQRIRATGGAPPG